MSVVPGPFYFSESCPVKGTGYKEKIILFLIILFQNILLSKKIFAFDGSFGFFTKLKRGRSGFWCTFSAWFFHKNVPYVILYQLRKFECHTYFDSQDIKQNVLLSSYETIDEVINFKIYLWSSSKAMANREKWVKDRNTKI